MIDPNDPYPKWIIVYLYVVFAYMFLIFLPSVLKGIFAT